MQKQVTDADVEPFATDALELAALWVQHKRGAVFDRLENAGSAHAALKLASETFAAINEHYSPFYAIQFACYGAYRD